MIVSDFELEQTRQSIRMLEAAIADQRRNVLPRSRAWFELMIEGSRAEIEELQAEVDEYLAKRDAPARRRA